MKSTKNEKGITLVALIITIIILLILAIVSIRAIKDGGILSKTQVAQKVYSESEEKEKIQLAINQAAIDGMGTINKAPLETALKEQFKDDFEITKETEEYFEVKIKSSGRIYTINKNGSIDKIEESWKDNGNGSYTKGDETVKIGDTYTNDEVKSKLKDKGVECKDGSYTGKWEVIGVEDDKIKLVSASNVTNTAYYLGYDDSEAKEAVADEDNLKRAIYSYTHAVNTLNKEASKATGIEGARSVTIEDIYGIIGEETVDKGSNYGTEYTYKYKKSKGQTFVDEKGKIEKIDSAEKEVKLKNTNFSYNLDENQKDKIGSLISGAFWLASPSVGCYSDHAYFYVRCMGSGFIGFDSLFSSDGDARGSSSQWV